MQTAQAGDMAKAAAFLGRVNIEIVKAAARRRQRHGGPAGARSPAGMGAAPVGLHELKEGLADGRPRRVTPLDHRTARRKLPPLLDRLPENDPRRIAAGMLAGAFERVGSVKGRDLAGGDSSGGISDGGATTRVKHAARLRLIEAHANGWPVDRRHGPTRGAPRALLTPGPQGRNRKQILAFPALVAICVDGAGLYAILRGHGWSAQSFNTQRLAAAILATLDDVAEGLGIGRASDHAGLDRK